MSNNTDDYPYLQQQQLELEALSFIIPPEELTIFENELPLRVQFKLTDPLYDQTNPQYCPLIITITLPKLYPVESKSTNGRPDLAFDYELVRMRECPDLFALTRWLSLAQRRQIIRAMIDMSKHAGGAEILFEFYQYLKDNLPFPIGKQSYENLQSQREQSEMKQSSSSPSSRQNHDQDDDDDDDDDAEDEYVLWAEMNEMDLDSYNNMTFHQPVSASASSASTSGALNISPDSHVLPPVRNLMSIPCSPDVVKRVESQLIEGDKLVIKKSIFQSFLYPVTSLQDVVDCMVYLYRSKHFSVATHNMIVYQYTIPSSAGMVRVLNYDEDGEKAAGKKMAMVMAQYDANCLVVVSRHYGGIMLGPERFKIIANQVQQALDKASYKKK